MCVQDANGMPLIGASVIIKGTNTGMITDIEGNFALDAKQGDIIVISYIGMKSAEVKVPANGQIRVMLKEDSQLMDEVVVTGYGDFKKATYTGSASVLNTDKLESLPVVSVAQMMEANIPGLSSVASSSQPGSKATVRVRGIASMNASTEPLYVLDGVPVASRDMSGLSANASAGGLGLIETLNPADIESITVLKDAASASLYGAKGSNGVILITSKRGKKDRLTVSYDTYVTIDQPINLPRMMNGKEFYKYKSEAFKATNTTPPTEENPEPWLDNFTPTELAMYAAGQSTDWMKLATQTGIKQQHNLSFRGGANKTSYFISLNYTDVKGTAVGNEFKRYNVRFNLDQEFNSWLKFSTTTQLGRYDRSGSSASFWRAIKQVPLGRAYNEDGSLTLSATEDSSSAFSINPLGSLNNKTKDIRAKVITNNVLEVKFPFIKGLSYKLNTGFTYQNSSYKNCQGWGSCSSAATTILRWISDPSFLYYASFPMDKSPAEHTALRGFCRLCGTI